MDTILEEKKKGQKNFRNKIDQFLIKSPYTKEQAQLTPQMIQQILSLPHLEGICVNGKVNIERLCEKISQSQGINTGKQLSRLLGNRKEMKINELHQLLKNFDLDSFDIEEQIVNYFFEDEYFSLKKLDQVMRNLGMNVLNSKDREILIQCFDYDKNKRISRSDIAEMMNICIEGRKKNQKQQFKTNTTPKEYYQA